MTDQLGMFDLPPLPAPPAEPEPPPDVIEAEEWAAPPTTVEEALTEAAPEPETCPRCGEEDGHAMTCPNRQSAARFVDVDELIRRQEEEPDDEPVEGQITAFGEDDDFRIQWAEWKGMPEYVSRDLAPFKSLLVHFETEDHYRQFAALVDQKWLTRKTRSIWYPEAEWARERGVARYADVSAGSNESEGPNV